MYKRQGVETVKLITMLIEQIVLDVIEPGSAPETRGQTHHQINSQGEENFIEERPEEEEIIIEVEEEIIKLWQVHPRKTEEDNGEAGPTIVNGEPGPSN